VAEAVEKLYGVKVARVNILTVKGKNKRSRTVRGQYGKTSDIKKAVVTLKQGESIETV
jgi:large subunit ribosomal protein L23